MSMTADQLKEHLSNEFAEIKAKIEERDEEIKEFGAAREQTGEKIDDLDSRLREIGEELKEIQSRQEEIGTKLDRPEYGEAGEQKSIGEQWAESEEYQRVLKNGKLQGGQSDRFEFKSFFPERKALALDPASAGGVIVQPLRVPGIIAAPDQRLFLRDLIPVTPTSQNAIEYVQETGYTVIFTTLRSDAAAAATTLEVESSNGFAVGDSINVGGETREVATVPDSDTITITAGLTGAQATGVRVSGTEINPVAEGELKPEGDLSFELVTANVRTIPTHIRASRQVLSDASMLQGYADNRLRYGLAFSEERQLLFGSGSGEQLQGILTHPDRSQHTAVAGDTILDTTRKAMTIAEDAEYPATGVVYNNHDWETVQLIKGTDEHYVWLSVTDGTQTRVFRLPVVVTRGMPEGRAAVGAFALANQIYDREQANTQIAEQHADLFLRNQVVIRAEERLALAHYRPEAIVDVDLTA